jgi:hypothetical protein
MNIDRYKSEPIGERRRERRSNSSCPVEFTLFGTENSNEEQYAVVVDLSREGLCLKTDNQLKTGTHLCLRMQEFNCANECHEEKVWARMLSVVEVKWCREIRFQKTICYVAGMKHVVVDY